MLSIQRKDPQRRVLFISMTGMAEPLGESQVLEYLEGLAKENQIYLFSFERKKDKSKLAALKQRISSAGIDWSYHRYSNRFGLISTFIMLITSFARLLAITLFFRPNIIHCRSFMPAVLGFIPAKIFRAKFLFDIRGFAIDEKVDSGHLRKTSFIYRYLNNAEHYLYRKSDYVITLTFAAREILINSFEVDAEKVTVIPTCANRALFFPANNREKQELRAKFGFSQNEVIFIHTGTTTGWYDFDSELKIFNELYKQGYAHHFIVLTRDDHALICQKFSNYDLPKSCYTLKEAELSAVRDWLILSDYAIFFIKPSFSKQASSPTKFAEMIACYLPSITNKGVGDMDYFMSQNNVGLALDINDIANNLSSALDKITEYMKEFSVNPAVYTEIFDKHFSKEIAIDKYNAVYETIMTKQQKNQLIKILALTKYGNMGASSRERFLIYFKKLEESGFKVTWKPMLPNEYLKAKYAWSKTSLQLIFFSYWRRIKNLLQAKNYDLIWLEYEALPYVPFFLERLTGLYKNKVIVDYDDAIFHNYDRHSFFLIRYFLKNKIKEVMRSSRVVCVGNSYLKNYAKQANAKHITYLPTVVNTDVYKPNQSRQNSSDFIKIGWLGSPSTQFHLTLIENVLKKLQTEIGIEFHVMGVDKEFQSPGLNTIVHQWSEAAQLNFLNGIDIGVMPLYVNDFAKGKCGYKLIQYMAYQKPVVATPLEVNKKIVDHGVNGFLAESDAEWFNALKTLCDDKVRRESMGKNGRDKVEKNYSVNAAFPVLLQAVHKVLMVVENNQ